MWFAVISINRSITLHIYISLEFCRPCIMITDNLYYVRTCVSIMVAVNFLCTDLPTAQTHLCTHFPTHAPLHTSPHTLTSAHISPHTHLCTHLSLTLTSPHIPLTHSPQHTSPSHTHLCTHLPHTLTFAHISLTHSPLHTSPSQTHLCTHLPHTLTSAHISLSEADNRATISRRDRELAELAPVPGGTSGGGVVGGDCSTTHLGTRLTGAEAYINGPILSINLMHIAHISHIHTLYTHSM